MVEDTMFSGESKNIEYKVSLPDKSEKYMKTIVAFANTQGGKLIVGVENDVLFQLMDGIANIFSQMGLVEAWGSGIKRILNAAEEYGLPKPRFQEFDNMFRVELFRNNLMTESEKKFGVNSEKSRSKAGDKTEKIQDNELTDTQKKIVNLLLANKQLSAAKIAKQLDLGSRSIEKNIKKLKEYGILKRHGSPKSGYWEIVEK